MAYPSTPVAAAFVTALRRAISAFLTHQRLAVSGKPRSVHEARVASRRLREILPSLPADPRVDRAALRREIRRAARALGRVREMDVALDLAARHIVPRGWSRDMATRVARELAKTRADRHETLVKKHGPDRRQDLGRQLRALGRWAGANAQTSAVGGALAARRRARARTLRQALEAAGFVYEPSTLHGVRIATKKLRYTLEWTRTVAGSGTIEAQIADLKGAQQLLGELNDLHTLQTYVRAIAARHPHLDRRSTKALNAGALQLEAAARERHAQFLKLVPRLKALAIDLGRKTPLEWIRRRPARIERAESGLRLEARGVRQ